MRSLNEMTLEELWELFPIQLERHNPMWANWYESEKHRLTQLLPDPNFYCSHIGSTAIPKIYAKNIVDILLEIPQAQPFTAIKHCLTENGYICMQEQPNRMSFNAGYLPTGFAKRVFHLHLRYWNDNDELYFRDYLIHHPQVAQDYEQLKKNLAKTYRNNRDAYTEAKTDFIQHFTRIAKECYTNRYLRK